MVGCWRCTFPSIHSFTWEETLKITVGCASCVGVVCGVWCGFVCCVLCVVCVFVFLSHQKKKEEGTFHYRNISGDEFIFLQF